MPALFTSVRLTRSQGLLQLITASNICLRCQISYLALRKPAIPRQNISLENINIRGGSRKCLSTRTKSQDATSDHREPPRQIQESSLLGSKSETVRSATFQDVCNASPLRKIDRSSKIPKLLSLFLDRIVVNATKAGHKINIITGTDYSSIEVLRREIKEQEIFVTLQNAAVHKAREAVDVAHTQQAASQKEVVGLLERKSSWSAADLERYMALIRSEHSNELAVQAAKESLKEAERALEEARSKLEKRERAQYHEEQVWSDTIRRNSTWVTIGLMGVNILILLSSVIMIEPWRRKNMVKEMRTVLDQHIAQQRLGATDTEASKNALNVGSVGSVGEIDNESAASSVPNEVAMPITINSVAAEPANPAEPFQASDLSSSELKSREMQPYSSLKRSLGANSPITRVIDYCETFLRNAFSAQHVTIRQNEVTKAILQGFSVGAALVAILFSVSRSS